MALVQKQSLKNPSGFAPTMSAASAGGDSIPSPDPETVLWVKNTSAGSLTATIVTPGTLSTGDAFPDKALVVPAAGDRFIQVGSEYADANGQAQITWSVTAGVTFAVFSL